VHQAEHWALRQVATEIAFGAYGTSSVVSLAASDPPPSAEVNGEAFLFSDSNMSRLDRAGGYRVHFADSLLPQTYHIRIFSSAEDSFRIDSITVLDRTYENLFGPAAALVIGLGMLAWVLVRALRERRR
jgi:hypothetical protein